MFESTSYPEGSLSSRVSKGSSTVEWLQANFNNRDLRDTVYVTANPQLEKNRHRWEIQLHETINVWIDNGWDSETGTVRAETVTKTAIDAAKQFPNKRLVVHYMQPHYPFVPTKTNFDKEHLSQISGGGDTPSDENMWNQKFKGELDVSREDLWSMYTDNLNYVLASVENLIDNISGMTIITADHGNYVGERASPIPIREYGHPRGLYDDTVVRVPWLVCEHENRREIRCEDSNATNYDSDITNSDIVEERLHDLGYK
jgi:hypothetical protein